MWIIKNSKELLEYLKSPTFNHVTSIKSFDFSTLDTTIPHQKWKDRLTSIIRHAFILKNGNRRYKYLVLGHEETYFVKEHFDSKNKYSEDDIIKMLEFLVDNIFVVFTWKVFQQTISIPMGTNCAPLLTDILLYSYEANFVQSLLSTGKKHLASRFNLTYRYIDEQPRIRTLSGPDVSCWTWDRGHHREHDFCFLPRFTTVDSEGWSTSHFDLRQTRWFQFHITNFRSWVVIFHLRKPMSFLSLNLYDTPGLAPRVNV